MWDWWKSCFTASKAEPYVTHTELRCFSHLFELLYIHNSRKKAMIWWGDESSFSTRKRYQIVGTFSRACPGALNPADSQSMATYVLTEEDNFVLQFPSLNPRMSIQLPTESMVAPINCRFEFHFSQQRLNVWATPEPWERWKFTITNDVQVAWQCAAFHPWGVKYLGLKAWRQIRTPQNCVFERRSK